MAQIVERFTGDRCIQLGAEEFVRKMTIGNNWMKIRIAVRVAIGGSADIPTPRFLLGVCSGTTYTYTSNSCIGYIGGVWPPTTISLPYIANAGNPYYQYSGGAAVCFGSVRKIGAVITEVSASSGNSNNVVAQSANNRYTLQMVDIFRSTTDPTAYGTRQWSCNTSVSTTNCDSYAFLRSIEDESVSSTFATTYITNSQGGFAVVYQTGFDPSQPMDTVSIGWGKSVPTIEIAEICVIRFY